MPSPAALVGRTITDADGRQLTVTGISAWSSNYAELEGEGVRTVRNVALLQRYFAATRA